MRCAYCNHPVNTGNPGQRNYQEYTVNLNNVECNVVVHNGCLDNLIGDFILARKLIENMAKAEKLGLEKKNYNPPNTQQNR